MTVVGELTASLGKQLVNTAGERGRVQKEETLWEMGVGFSWAHRRKSLGRRKGRADQDRIPQSRQWAFKQEHSS